MTIRHSPLDPDDPDGSRIVETELAEALSPIALPDAIGLALRQRLVERARRSREAAAKFVNVRRDEGSWQTLFQGARAKVLHAGSLTRSVMIELDPGGSLPAHRHHEHEECIVLRGEARLGDLEVREGDYHVSPRGSRHGLVVSRDGALLFLRGVPIGEPLEVARDLVTAWLPGKDIAATTIRSDEGTWTPLLPGVQTKLLWKSGLAQSMLVRMQPGASVPSHPHAIDEECLVLEGEMFLGDTLMRAGDYQLAPTGTRDADVVSDVGALFFVRGAMEHAPTP